LEVIAPEQKSVLTWNPPSDNSLNIKGENDNLQPGSWKVPIFTIKNAAPINAQDVTVRWSATRYDATTMTANKAVFEGRQSNIGNEQITLSALGGVAFINPFRFSVSLDKPFITRSAETYIPLDVWNTGAPYILSTLPAQIGSRSEPYYFDLQISWNIPENAKPARYRVKAVATRTGLSDGANGPALAATIEFFVEPDT
jgi:hypothetical protein